VRKHISGQAVANECIARKGNFRPPTKISSREAAEEHIPGTETPRECRPAFRSALAVAGTEDAMPKKSLAAVAGMDAWS